MFKWLNPTIEVTNFTGCNNYKRLHLPTHNTEEGEAQEQLSKVTVDYIN